MALHAEWDEKYAALADYTCRIAQNLLKDADAATPSAKYMVAQARLFTAAHADENRPRPEGAASDALDAIAAAWPGIQSGSDSGELLFQRNWLTWHRLMSEWPMGHYAEMVVSALSAIDTPLDTVVELGAGVGATTRQIQRLLTSRGSGRVVATDLVYKPPAAVDFDRPLAGQVPISEAVVATNALHCANDAEATLRWIREVLKPGGWLVIGEGAPMPEPGVPWALNLLFGACRGWHDRVGFRTPEFWIDAMRQAGFEDIARTPWPSDRYELGGTIVGRAA